MNKAYIKTLTENEGRDIIYPRTVSDALFDSDGKALIPKINHSISETNEKVKENADSITDINTKLLYSEAAGEGSVTTPELDPINEIYKLDDKVNSANAKIDENAESIKANAVKIANNTANIDKNAAAIKSNAGNISSNTAAIQDNTKQINSNATKINENSVAIKSNASNISKNATAIKDNKDSIDSLRENIITTKGNETKDTRLVVNNESSAAYEIYTVDEVNKVVDDAKTDLANKIDDNKDSIDTINSKLLYSEAAGEGSTSNQKLDPVNEIYKLNDKVNSANARIDKLLALPDGSTTGDAELIDIRVKANGEVASSAGSAVREQINDVNNKIDENVNQIKGDLSEICSHFEQSLNLINPASITPGIVIDKNTGEEVSNAGYSITDYISVTPGEYAYKNIQYIALYKEGYVFSRRLNKVDASKTTVKSGEVSVRVIGKIGTEETWRFNQGAIVVDEPYSEYPSLVNVDLSKLDIEPMATEALTDASGKTYRSLKERLDTESGKEIQHIKDPFSLPIRMGYWSAGGAFNANFQNAGFLLDVKAGSTIKCKTSDVQFQTRLAPASGTDAVYTTYRSGNYTVPEDGTLFFSVRYIDKRQIVNNSILANIDIDLIVDGMDVKYSRNVYANRVIPAITHFRTLDNTGFNQDTPYDDIISAFDALCDGTFLKKTVLASVDIGGGITKDICQYRYSVTGNHKNNYPKVILIGSMHGHEKSATYGIYYMLREVIDNACETDMGLWLKSNVNMVIVPACNPYGWEHNNRYNANGVNINRNFGTYGWGEYMPTDESGNPTYNAWQYDAKGDAPCDQTETQAICRVLAENADAVACFDCHTNGLSTEAMYEVFTLNLPYDFDCNEKSKKMNNCILDYRSYIKPFMDGNYGVQLTSPWYGSVGVGDEKPMLSTYCADSASIFGLLLEVTPGSKSGFLGDRLAKYTPEVIQLCGELTAFAVATIIGYEKQIGLIH